MTIGTNIRSLAIRYASEVGRRWQIDGERDFERAS